MRSLLLFPSSVRRLGLGVGLALLVGLPADAHADAGDTPATSLVPFLVKAADYDRHFASKAGGRVEVLVTFNAGEPTSHAMANEIAKELGRAGKIAGFSHDERVEPYTGAEALAAEVRSTQTAIVVVSTRLGGEAPAIAHELDGIDVLTIAADPDDVARGIVVGLDQRAAKPKIVVRLAQARRQDVAFEASFLALARIE